MPGSSAASGNPARRDRAGARTRYARVRAPRAPRRGPPLQTPARSVPPSGQPGVVADSKGSLEDRQTPATPAAVRAQAPSTPHRTAHPRPWGRSAHDEKVGQSQAGPRRAQHREPRGPIAEMSSAQISMTRSRTTARSCKGSISTARNAIPRARKRAAISRACVLARTRTAMRHSGCRCGAPR